jgi:hypothetical protein
MQSWLSSLTKGWLIRLLGLLALSWGCAKEPIEPVLLDNKPLSPGIYYITKPSILRLQQNNVIILNEGLVLYLYDDGRLEIKMALAVVRG